MTIATDALIKGNQRYEELKKLGRKYYELTKDTSVIRLLY